MKKLMTNRWSHFVMLLSLLFAVIFVVPIDGDLRQRIQFLTFDYYLKTFPRQPENRVVIVDIDDESLAKIGQWPWPRTVVAKIVENLTSMGARVIAFDGVLAEPDRTSSLRWLELANDAELKSILETVSHKLSDNDAYLAKVIMDSGIFVAGFSHGSNTESPRVVNSIAAVWKIRELFTKSVQQFSGSAQFLPELEDVAAGNGSFMAEAEIDGVIRKTSLLFSDGVNLYPSLSVEALRVATGQKDSIKIGKNKDFTENSIDTEYWLVIDDYVTPIERDAKIWVHYRDFNEMNDYVPVWKIIEQVTEEEIRAAISGKIVFIGSSAEGLLDLRSTPLGLRPGVEIHANALEQILDGKYLSRPKIIKDAENNFILSIGLLLIMLAPFIGASWLALICFSLVGGVSYLSYYSFIQHGLLIDPVYPVIAVLVIYIFSSVLSYIRTEAERKQVRSAFGLYISPDFMKELTRDPGKLKLGGDLRDLSVMFTDIRNFTTISESMTPEALIQLMNDFLTPMSDLVMANRGTIDKYMGDAMMAFWNAPLDDSDHARNACRTALQMNRALEPINDRLKEQAAREGKTPLVLEAGIGINTGPASVGNMGSRQRFAYSALGDTVNLASRLEGQTKQYGVRVLVGEKTRRAAPEFAMLELDLIRVKGKREPERIFVLLGDEEMAQGDFFKGWEEIHNGMLADYRAMKWDDARKKADKCHALCGEGMKLFYDVFITRIADLKKNPPRPDWDGVTVATTK